MNTPMSSVPRRPRLQTHQDTILTAIALLGVFIRVRLYLFNRSLWSDEALLALNLQARDLPALLTQPLDLAQAAPTGFLVVTKVLCLVLGDYDSVLRIVPFLSSLGALALGVALARRALRDPVARWTFVGLLAFSPVLLYYGTEFKHYSSDVFFAMACLYAYARRQDGLRWCAAVGAVGLFFSFSVVFVLAGLGIALVVDIVRRRAWQEVRRLAVVCACWLASFAVSYFTVQRTYAQDHYLREYWLSGYAPFPPTTWEAVRWYGESWVGFAHMSFRQLMPAPPGALPSWFESWTLVLALIILAASAWLFYRRQALAVVIGVALLANLVASTLEIYPFRNRLIIYLVPMVYWAAAVLVQACLLRRERGWRVAGVVMAIALVGTVAVTAYRVTVHPPAFSNTKKALEVISSRAVRGDTLSLNSWGEAAHRYYRQRYLAGALPLAANVPDDHDVDDYIADLRAYPGGRLWILHVHDMGAGPFFSSLADQSDLTQVWQGNRGAVYVLSLDSLTAPARSQ